LNIDHLKAFADALRAKFALPGSASPEDQLKPVVANLLESAGALYRNGERHHVQPIVRLQDDPTEVGRAATTEDETTALERLFRDFPVWQPNVPPTPESSPITQRRSRTIDVEQTFPYTLFFMFKNLRNNSLPL